MRELLVRGKNTIDPEVIDPGGRSVEDSPVKSDFTFTFIYNVLHSSKDSMQHNNRKKLHNLPFKEKMYYYNFNKFTLSNSNVNPTRI
jgi:hypothetical protein